VSGAPPASNALFQSSFLAVSSSSISSEFCFVGPGVLVSVAVSTQVASAIRRRDNVGDYRAPTAAQHAINFAEYFAFVWVSHEIEYAVRHHRVLALVRYQRGAWALTGEEVVKPRQVLDSSDGILSEPRVNRVEVCGEIL
jgi:hypothetical protein